MKITKSELKKIIREELEQVTEGTLTEGKSTEELADMVEDDVDNIIKIAKQLKSIASKGGKGNWNKADQLVDSIRAIVIRQLMLSVDKIKRSGA